MSTEGVGDTTGTNTNSDWMTSAGIGALIGGIGSAFSSYKETKRGHKWSEREAEKTREFNAEQAAINRDFQERMSNTQHQRAADDLQAAGLNRILALGRPAAASSGATASSSTPGNPGVKSVGEAGIRSASAMASIRQIEAQEDLLRSQARYTDENTRKTGIEADTQEVKKFFYSVLQNLLGEDGQSAQYLASQIRSFLGIGQEEPVNKSSWWDKLMKKDPPTRSHPNKYSGKSGGGGR